MTSIYSLIILSYPDPETSSGWRKELKVIETVIRHAELDSASHQKSEKQEAQKQVQGDVKKMFKVTNVNAILFSQLFGTKFRRFVAINLVLGPCPFWFFP